MLFDFKAIALYGLLAGALATPVSISGSPELEVRAKKKKITPFKCENVTLTKEAVGSAFSKGKGLADEALGPQNGQKYPHKFGNKVGNNEEVFKGVKKELREFPIIEGGEYEGHSAGVYRVVYGEKDKNLVGVMVEKAGGTFVRCEPVKNKN